jgi:hypothetical protein
MKPLHGIPAVFVVTLAPLIVVTGAVPFAYQPKVFSQVGMFLGRCEWDYAREHIINERHSE